MTYTQYRDFRTASLAAVKAFRAQNDRRMVKMLQGVMGHGRRQRADYRWSSRHADTFNAAAGYAVVNKALRAEQMKRAHLA